MISGPWPGLSNVPSTTFQTLTALGLSIFHPVRSLPLNNGTGVPQTGAFARFNDGARFPVHDQSFPSGAATVPESVSPVSAPSNTMSRFASSSSLGETNVRCPADTSILGSGRAFPQRPTICAANFPSVSLISNQEGYSRSGAFRVRSQRPRYCFGDGLG